ncbi:hypothetical protein BC936DRAFT_146494 [Jimgerdemannia flammicorona]|uniref:Uncharacterized protein n=2 Tax=Jimgerdemannia flammicorona TaxID=994334 RepID=A0A433D7K2_9FUNG|nr:hypothetical protein BC936DRAFT_146494 [Jimgerdemannia flammicorona]RUS30458.1 hypothetical protein BC938DRAFT_479369 [Jimgerdemannia flammicorona]
MATPSTTSNYPSVPATPTATTMPYQFQRSDFTLLPQLAQILERLEQGQDLAEIGRAVKGLNESFVRCQRILDQLPGADLSREEQENQLRQETQVLTLKKAQLRQYMNLPLISAQLVDEAGSLLAETESVTIFEPMDIGSG